MLTTQGLTHTLPKRGRWKGILTGFPKRGLGPGTNVETETIWDNKQGRGLDWFIVFGFSRKKPTEPLPRELCIVKKEREMERKSDG